MIVVNGYALAGTYDLKVVMSPESVDFDVLAVRPCLYDEGEMVHVLCEWRGQPMSLFVVPNRRPATSCLRWWGTARYSGHEGETRTCW